MDKDTPAAEGALGRRIVRGMAVIIFFGLFLKLGGFLINVLVIRYYDVGAVSDAFMAIYNTVFILLFFSSFLKVILPVFMPLFAERMHEAGEEAAWQLTNTVLNLALLAALAAAGLTFCFAEEIVSTVLPEFSATAHAAAVALLRWMMPGVIFVSFAIVAQGILNSYKVFSFPAAGDATQKLVWAGALFVMVTVLGVSRDASHAPRVLGAGFLIACGAQFAVLLIGLRKWLRNYRAALPAVSPQRLAIEAAWLATAAALFVAWVLVLGRCAALPERAAFRITDRTRQFLILTGFLAAGGLYAVSLWRRGGRRRGIMAKFALLAGPLVFGVIFARGRDLVFMFFQSYTAEGDYTIIDLAKKVTNLPIVLMAYAVGIAMFPYLCDLAAKKDTATFGRLVGRTLRVIALFFIPLTVITITLSAPVMRFIWDRGTWSPERLQAAAMALAILSTGIFFMSVENVLMQSFFSLQQTLLPTALGIVLSSLCIVGLYVAIEGIGADAPSQVFLILCIVYPAPRILKNICLILFLGRRLPVIRWRDDLLFALKLAAVCAGVAAAGWAVHRAVADWIPLADLAGRNLLFEAVKGLHVAIPSLAALAAFLILCLVLRIEEFRLVLDWLRHRAWKEKPPASPQTSDHVLP